LIIRPFATSDYESVAAISALIDPDRGRDAEWFRARDASLFGDPKMRQLRLVAEVDGRVVGWGDMFTAWWAYHPRKFQLRLNVEPTHQVHGIGSALYTGLMESGWDPLRINAETRETRPSAMQFLSHRGFLEVARRWEAVLRVKEARFEPRHVETVRITSIGEERRRRGDEALNRALFELERVVYRDEPGYDPEGALQFDQFVANELDPEVLVDDASFLAFDGDRLVAVSRIERDRSGPGRLHIGFTGTHPEVRGRGIAIALKLRGLEYARAHDVDEIRTTNDASNAAMLHINEKLGFTRLPAWVVFEKHFAA